MADLTETEMRMALARLCRQTTQRDVAKRFCFTPQFISDVLAGRRYVTDALARAMGYERVTRFRRKGVPRG